MIQVPDHYTCPKCGNSMLLGHSPVAAARTILSWTPGLDRSIDLSSIFHNSKQKTIFFRGFGIGTHYSPSWYCEKCGLLLIDTQLELS